VIFDSLQHARAVRTTEDGFERESIDVSPEKVTAPSQSSLNTYANSTPRLLFQSTASITRTKSTSEKETCFHDFAEFYVSHPDVITTDTLDEVAAIILDEVDPFLRGVDREVRLTKYRVGIQTIVEFLEANPPQGDVRDDAPIAAGERISSRNITTAPSMRRTLSAGSRTPTSGLRGRENRPRSKPDPTPRLQEWAKKSAYSIVKHSALDPPGDKPNFQALLYLAHQRTEHPDEELRFTFFHFLETLDDVVTGDGNLDDCLTTVTYYPVAFEEYIASRTVFTELQEDAANDCTKTFSKSTYEVYVRRVGCVRVPRHQRQ